MASHSPVAREGPTPSHDTSPSMAEGPDEIGPAGTHQREGR
jgi:hypothetical protein